MVIIFDYKEPRDYLEKNGFVYTLRSPKRKHVGKDWYNYHRCGIKRGDVDITFIREIEDPEELEPFVYNSGFKTLEDWLKKAKKSKYLYWVRINHPMKKID